MRGYTDASMSFLPILWHLLLGSVGGPVYKEVVPKGDHIGYGPRGPDAYILAGVVMNVTEAPGGRQEIGIINISFAVEWLKEVIDREVSHNLKQFYTIYQLYRLF